MSSWENHFGKTTAWSLICFLNYSLLSHLAQLQILVISLYLGTYFVRRKYYIFLSISMTIYQFVIALGFHLKITHYLVSI